MLLSRAISGETITQGQYNVSIGTSLALETLFGINENIAPTNPLPFTRYGCLFINVRTLIRNLHGAVAKELKTEWTLEHYYRELLKELAAIPEIVSNQSHDNLSVVYYFCKYQRLEKDYPHANLKKKRNASHYDVIENNLLNRVENLTRTGKVSVLIVDHVVPLPDEKVVMMTHLPLDLIPYAQTSRVDLIETHTGVIKDRFKWYTKLNGSGLERIPFTRKTIQIFGDGKTFSGIIPRWRSLVVEFAEKNKWNQTTSDRIIEAQMSRFPDKEAAKLIMSL